MPDSYCEEIELWRAPWIRDKLKRATQDREKMLRNLLSSYWETLVRHGYDRTFAFHVVYG